MSTTYAKRTRIVLGPDSAGILMTPDEFDAITEYDPEFRYELIHGVVVVSPMPREAEVDPNEELGYMLRTYHDQHPRGSALNVTLPERYIHTADSRRRADRVIWAGLDRMPDPDEDVPTIAVEFVSAGKRHARRDYVEKRKEYREVGVREYWIIDRFRRTLTACVYTGARTREVVIHENQTYRTALLPGFEFPLARLLALADRWA